MAQAQYVALGAGWNSAVPDTGVGIIMASSWHDRGMINGRPDSLQIISQRRSWQGA